MAKLNDRSEVTQLQPSSIIYGSGDPHGNTDDGKVKISTLTEYLEGAINNESNIIAEQTLDTAAATIDFSALNDITECEFEILIPIAAADDDVTINFNGETTDYRAQRIGAVSGANLSPVAGTNPIIGKTSDFDVAIVEGSIRTVSDKFLSSSRSFCRTDATNLTQVYDMCRRTVADAGGLQQIEFKTQLGTLFPVGTKAILRSLPEPITQVVTTSNGFSIPIPIASALTEFDLEMLIPSGGGNSDFINLIINNSFSNYFSQALSATGGAYDPVSEASYTVIGNYTDFGETNVIARVRSVADRIMVTAESNGLDSATDIAQFFDVMKRTVTDVGGATQLEIQSDSGSDFNTGTVVNIRPANAAGPTAGAEVLASLTTTSLTTDLSLTGLGGLTEFDFEVLCPTTGNLDDVGLEFNGTTSNYRVQRFSATDGSQNAASAQGFPLVAVLGDVGPTLILGSVRSVGDRLVCFCQSHTRVNATGMIQSYDIMQRTVDDVGGVTQLRFFSDSGTDFAIGTTVRILSTNPGAIPAQSGVTFTDGTNTVEGATSLTVTGGTVGGTSPDATLTIAAGSAANAEQLTYSNNTTIADPGAGTIRFDSTTVGSITEAAIDELLDNGDSYASLLAAVGNGTFIRLTQASDSTKSALFLASADSVNETGWYRVTLAHQAGTLPDNGALCNISVELVGAGTGGGGAGNRIIAEETLTVASSQIDITGLSNLTEFEFEYLGGASSASDDLKIEINGITTNYRGQIIQIYDGGAPVIVPYPFAYAGYLGSVRPDHIFGRVRVIDGYMFVQAHSVTSETGAPNFMVQNWTVGYLETQQPGGITSVSFKADNGSNMPIGATIRLLDPVSTGGGSGSGGTSELRQLNFFLPGDDFRDNETGAYWDDDGTVTVVTGKIGNALSFPGAIGSRLSQATSLKRNTFGHRNWSFACWLRVDTGSNGTTRSIISRDPFSDNLRAVLIGVNASNEFFGTFGPADNSGTSTQTVSGTATVTEEQWHHLVITYDGDTGEVTIYFDSVQDAQVTLATIDHADSPEILRTWIGVREFNQPLAGFDIAYDGELEQLLLTDFVMDQSDVDALWNSSNGTADVRTALSIGAAVSGGSTPLSITEQTANYTVVAGDLDTSIDLDATGGAFTITLDTLASNGFIDFAKQDASANAVTLTAGGTATLLTKASATDLTAQYDRVSCRYDATADEWLCSGDLA